MSIDSINEMIQTIKDILQDLSDDGWLITVTYLPKRFGTFNSDIIRVDIRKNKWPLNLGKKYSLDSEFKLSDIKTYTLRIIDYINSDSILISICEKIPSVFELSYLPDHLRVKWDDFSEIDDKIYSDLNVLDIVLQIPLDGDNLDQFNYNSILSDWVG